LSEGLAQIGAAVIGTGFIGTVHVQALRRIGVKRAEQFGGLAEGSLLVGAVLPGKHQVSNLQVAIFR